MKVTRIRESLEPCEEAGWQAYDLSLDEKMDEEMIRRLGALGDLTYLGMLRQPFYRIEQRYYMIRGLQGSDTLRVALLSGEEEILGQVKKLLETDEKEGTAAEKG